MKSHLDYRRSVFTEFTPGVAPVAGAPTVPLRQPPRTTETTECFQLPNLVGTDIYMLKNQDKVHFCSLCTRKVQNTKYPRAEKTSDQTILSKKGKVTYKLYWS